MGLDIFFIEDIRNALVAGERSQHGTTGKSI